MPIGRRALKFLAREVTVHLVRPPAGHSRTNPARPGGVRAVAAESLAVKHQLDDHEAFAASESEPDPMGSGDSRVLHAPGVARTLGQDGCDLEDFNPPESSPSPGAAKISVALRLRATPAPRT